MTINLENVKSFLIRKWDYPEEQINDVLTQISDMPPDLQQSFELWMQTGKLNTDLNYNGFNLTSIIDKLGFIPPAAFLLLSWIYHEPNKAQEFIISEFGHDAFMNTRTILKESKNKKDSNQ